MTEDNLESNEDMGRRTLLRRAAIGGAAVVWATPVVQTLGQGVAAAGTPVILACPDGNQSPRPRTLTFEWTGQPCDDPPPPAQTGTPTGGTGTISGTVYITAAYGGGAKSTTVEWLEVDQGDLITIGPKPPGDWDNELSTGGDQKLNPEVTFTVYDSKGGTELRSVTIHTSCSAPLHENANYCGFVLRAATF